MDIGALTGSGGGGAESAAPTNRFSDLSSEQFLKVMISELRNQDPLKPQDSSKLLEQMSSLRNIETQSALQDELGKLVTQNQIASAGNLIGQRVAGLDGSNNQVEGLVTAVRVRDEQVMLELDTGQRLAMSRVTSISPEPTPSSGGA